jgi:hypothetical protein
MHHAISKREKRNLYLSAASFAAVSLQLHCAQLQARCHAHRSAAGQQLDHRVCGPTSANLSLTFAQSQARHAQATSHFKEAVSCLLRSSAAVYLQLHCAQLPARCHAHRSALQVPTFSFTTEACKGIMPLSVLCLSAALSAAVCLQLHCAQLPARCHAHSSAAGEQLDHRVCGPHQEPRAGKVPAGRRGEEESKGACCGHRVRRYELGCCRGINKNLSTYSSLSANLNA